MPQNLELRYTQTDLLNKYTKKSSTQTSRKHLSTVKPVPRRKTPLLMLTHIENIATGLNLLAYKNETPTPREISGVMNNGIQVTLTTGSCLKSHLISVKLLLVTSGQKLDLHATGQVTAVETFGEQILVDIEFKEFNRKDWNKLLETFETSQSHVTNLFERIKGES